MTKSQLRKKINNKICGLAKGLFSDEYWYGHNIICEALNEIEGIEFHLNNCQYEHDEYTGNPIRKRWMYEVTDGKNQVYVLIIAAGAGSVNDPLEKYDIIAYSC